MDGPNFDPVVGEEVRVIGQSGLFKIVDVSRAVVRPTVLNMPVITDGAFEVSLKREGRNTVIAGVPWSSLQYVDDEVRKVCRTVEWLKKNPDNRQYPDYIVDYEVEARNDQLGNPSIFVRFLVDQDYFYENSRPARERIAALNKFTFDVEQVLLGLDLDRWIYVQSGVAQRAFDVAS